MEKTYICNRYHSLQIGNPGGEHIVFKNGTFTTDDAKQQKVIEASPDFNVYVFLQDGDAEAAAPESVYARKPTKKKPRSIEEIEQEESHAPAQR